MGKNVIVSEETIRDLLEAHASLSAWYYELWAALRAANASAKPPDDAARAAFVERLGSDFPELAAVAKQIRVPRAFVPSPPAIAAVPPGLGKDEPETLIEPAPARTREKSGAPPADEGPPMPPLVKPGSVKY